MRQGAKAAKTAHDIESSIVERFNELTGPKPPPEPPSAGQSSVEFEI